METQEVGTLGDLGCFSFQGSKNLNSGEGGAILTNRDDLYRTMQSFQNNGRALPDAGFAYIRNGANFRMTEFQAALLTAQITRVESQSRNREHNATYLSSLLHEIPGITPAKMYEGCTRNAYHLYMFNYDPKQFAGLPAPGSSRRCTPRDALHGGLAPLYREPFLKNTLQSRAYQAIYSSKRIADYLDNIHCPVNDGLCESVIWMTQTSLLGPAQTWIRLPRRFARSRNRRGSW